MGKTDSKKHAYLIMAYNNFTQLQTLLSLLDDPRNDIYLHIDKKAKTFDAAMVNVRYSKLVLIDRISVNWGGHSQIVCELNLLKAAVTKKYQYYHLLSGVDFPIKTQDEIHAFFESSYPKNYIDFDRAAIESRSFLSRISQYHVFQDKVGRNSGWHISVLEKMERCLLLLQNKLGVRRKQYIQSYKGGNWFSITDALAQYVIEQEALIRRQFFYSICADEVFLQSVAMASPYRDDIVNDCLRAIDWERGRPYTYRREDVDGLLVSPKFFARKLDSNVDPVAIDKIVEYLSNRK